MITEVCVVINNDEQKDTIAKSDIKISPFFTFIDERKDKSKAWKFKGAFSARECPFAIVYENNKPIKAFYSEVGDALNSLIQYLNEDIH